MSAWDIRPTVVSLSKPNALMVVVYEKGVPPELYDRKQDPDQMDNLADSSTNVGIMAKLEIESQKELKSIGLNKRNIAKGPKNQE